MSAPVIPVVAVAASIVAAVLLALIIEFAVRRIRRRVDALGHLAHLRRPFRILAAAAAAVWAIHRYPPPAGWHVVQHVADLVLIAAAGWMLTSLLFVVEDSAMPRLRVDMRDNRHARAIRTQLLVLRRVTAAVVTVLALGAALMTFREARLVGTSLLASAGVAAAIAAFATNTLLSNLIAGLQIAFGGALRLDDVVVVQEEWGRVEQITLTYVVVHIWDDRRLILPTSYFTTQPFENWTHTTSDLIGAVIIDVDWTVDVEGLRERLRATLGAQPLWDGRAGSVQVVDAVGGHVTVRALVSAGDAPGLWELRCAVREDLVAYLLETGAAPRTRAEFQTVTIGAQRGANGAAAAGLSGGRGTSD
jgi:small-conductance mechanosensitive channel